MFESEKSENGKSLHRAEKYGRMRRQLSGETNSYNLFLFEREFRWVFFTRCLGYDLISFLGHIFFELFEKRRDKKNKMSNQIL